jgi:hypothetical protein
LQRCLAYRISTNKQQRNLPQSGDKIQNETLCQLHWELRRPWRSGDLGRVLATARSNHFVVDSIGRYAQLCHLLCDL